MDYLDFEVEIERGKDHQYPLAILSPAGEVYSSIRLPFDEAALETYRKEMQSMLSRASSLLRRALSDKEQGVQYVHQQLFEMLMVGEARNAYDVSQRKANREGKGLRLRLRIHAPELVGLPWEYLYDPVLGEYLSLSKNTQIVRYLELTKPIHPLKATPPLRLLVMIANPGDRQPIEVAYEQERLRVALGGLESAGVIKVTWLEGGSWQHLQQGITQGFWHILHFIGHGVADPNVDDGFLALAHDSGTTHLVSATELGYLLGEHGFLRLVVLCTPKGGTKHQGDVFATSAATLARRGVAGVLAVQHELSEQAASEYFRVFYTALAQGKPVDEAVMEARRSLTQSIPNTLQWGTPLLQMRRPDGALFDLAHKPMIFRSSALRSMPPLAREASPKLAQAGGRKRQSGKLIRPPALEVKEALQAREDISEAETALLNASEDISEAETALLNASEDISEAETALLNASEAEAIEELETQPLPDLFSKRAAAPAAEETNQDAGGETQPLSDLFFKPAAYPAVEETSPEAETETQPLPDLFSKPEAPPEAEETSPEAEVESDQPTDEAPAVSAEPATEEDTAVAPLDEAATQEEAPAPIAEPTTEEVVAVVAPAPTAEMWMQTGQIAQAAGRYEGALAAYDRAAHLAPKEARVFLGKGEALWGLQRAEEALIAYRRANQLDEALVPALVGAGLAFVAVECYEDALTTLERALTLDPTQARAVQGKGDALGWLHREEEALAAYEQALVLGLENAPLHNGRGIVLWSLKRPQEALIAFERAIELDPAYALAHFNKGETLLALKRKDAARESFKKARDLGYQADAE